MVSDRGMLMVPAALVAGLFVGCSGTDIERQTDEQAVLREPTEGISPIDYADSSFRAVVVEKPTIVAYSSRLLAHDHPFVSGRVAVRGLADTPGFAFTTRTGTAFALHYRDTQRMHRPLGLDSVGGYLLVAPGVIPQRIPVGTKVSEWREILERFLTYCCEELPYRRPL